MALVPGQYLEIQFRYTYLGQKLMTRQHYQMQGAAFLTADVVQVAEAYWNDVKTLWRSLFSTASTVSTQDALFVREIGNGLQYAEYAIPSGERVGTRAAGDDGEWVAPFMAAGVKLTVGSSVTRPGQKRISSMREGDIVGNSLISAHQTLVDNVAVIFSDPRTLGAPVALGVLQPVIGGTLIDGDPTVWQNVTGQVVNAFITSQVSRKIGHGS